MRERETKLEPPEGLDWSTIVSAVAAVDGVSVHRVDDRELAAHYYDTEDFRLARWGVTLRHRDDEGWTVKLPVDTSGTESVRDEVPIESDAPGGRTQPPTSAVRLVDSFTLGAKVRRVAQLVTTRRVLSMSLDGEPLGELTDDHVRIEPDKSRESMHPTEFRELELELAVTADTGMTDEVVASLRALGCKPAWHGSKIARAIGPAATEPPEVVVPEIPDDPDAGAIVHHAFASSVVQLIRNLPVARIGDDPEGVHQARVALRRLRSDLRTFRPLLDRDWADDLRRRAKWLADALGDVRDDDVHIEIVSHAGASDGVVEVLREEREGHRTTLIAALDKPRTRQLLTALVDAANEPLLLPEAAKRADKALFPLVRKRWKRLRNAVASLSDDPSTDELHGIRILTKRCRYAAMATAPAFGQPALTFAKRLGKLQDVLGDVHDFELLAHRLHDIALGLPPEDAFSAGEAAGRLRQMADESRDAWPHRWMKSKQVAPDRL